VASTDPLLTDLRLELRHYELRPVYVAATELRVVPRQPRRLADLGRVGGRGNLEQAIMMRLLTPRGELAGLGHPEYGSRLHELVGSENTPTTRNRIKLYVLECLQAEPRIEKVLDVSVEPVAGRPNRDRVNVTLRIRPLADPEALDIGPLTLELGS
jgi:phage baseplate assembly protein W